MAGYKTWVPGEEVLAADLQGFIQEQVVAQFTTAAQRDAQWPTPPDGALSETLDNHFLWRRIGTAWVAEPRSVTNVIGADFTVPPTTNTIAYAADFGGGHATENVVISLNLGLSQASIGAFDVNITGGPGGLVHQEPAGRTFLLLSTAIIWPAPSPPVIQVRVTINTWGAKAVVLSRWSSSVATYSRKA